VRVDLPLPLGPAKTSVSPSFKSKDISFKAGFSVGFEP
jgi:hypothetical protein